MPMTRTIFFLFTGFFGRGGADVGIDAGTRGVGGRSLGEKSRGINRFFAGVATAGRAGATGAGAAAVQGRRVVKIPARVGWGGAGRGG